LEEHTSNGNKFGITDRWFRTLRELIKKKIDVTGQRTDNMKNVESSVIDTYNSHRTWNNKTPFQAKTMMTN